MNFEDRTIEITQSEKKLKNIKMNRASGICDVIKKNRCDVHVRRKREIRSSDKKYLKK